MKILYAIQGTGNGHLSRARDIIPILQQKGEVDILISGEHSEISLPYPIKYSLKGLGFVFGKKGGVDLLETYKKGSLKRLYEEIKGVPVENYDLVINDFEPVTAWACKMKQLPCIGLSHQAAVINKKSPKPKKGDLLGKAILKNYAPVTASYGFHFKAYDKSIFTPVIRSQVRWATPQDLGHYTVYLPAYGNDKIITILSQIENVQWEVFSKHCKAGLKENNVHIRPIDNELFLQSLLTCSAVLCGAGFETPAEALFLQKKLLVIPMKNQYEQQCNAAALKTMGVPVIKALKKKYLAAIQTWVDTDQILPVIYPDDTEKVIDMLLQKHGLAEAKTETALGEGISSAKELKHKSLGKILAGLYQ